MGANTQFFQPTHPRIGSWKMLGETEVFRLNTAGEKARSLIWKQEEEEEELVTFGEVGGASGWTLAVGAEIVSFCFS